jgi:hypothetical protein
MRFMRGSWLVLTWQVVMESQLRAIDDPDMFGCAGEPDPRPSQFWRSLRTCPDGMTCVVGDKQCML